MHIVLVNPPFEEEDSVSGNKSIKKVLNVVPPLGLAYLAAYVRPDGHEVQIIDCTVGISHQELIDRVVEENPDVIGITGTTPSSESMKKAAVDIRDRLPKAAIVVGGAHITAMPEETMASGLFDVGVIGEGETTFLDLVRHIEKQGLKHLEAVDGIVFNENGRVVFTGRRPFIEQLDEIPFPARDLLPPLTAYHPTPASYKKLPLAVVITSRGCPFKCKFCDRAIFGATYRGRSAGNVMDEVESLVKDYGAREIRFFDDTFTMDKKRVMMICDEFERRNIRIPWTCLTRVNTVTRELLMRMRKAGCWQVLYGLESGDQKMLDLLHKGTTVEQNTRAVQWAKEAGMSVRGDFIVGTPGDTLESMEKTLAFAKSMDLDYAHFNKFVPLPGTELYQMLVDQGHTFDFTEHSSIVDHSALLYVPEGMKREDYKAFLDRAHKEFYLRPSYIFKRLLQIRSLAQLKGQIDGFFAIKGL